MPIMIKGVNRHMHEDRRGKAVTEESMVADIKLLKQFNFNAVRNAHYPNNNRWQAPYLPLPLFYGILHSSCSISAISAEQY